MTTLKTDYNNTVIYKICCNNPDITEVYVGFTTNFLNRRNKHKSNCNNENGERYNLKVYKFIRENGGWENWNMLIVEKYPCNNGIEAQSRERFYYEKLNSKLNTQYPGRKFNKNDYFKDYNANRRKDGKEYRKEYYQKNIVKIKENRKEYYENNIIKIKENQKEYSKEYYEKNIIKLKENQKKYQEYKKEYAKGKLLCECGEDICRSNKTNHLKTQKHLSLMQSKV